MLFKNKNTGVVVDVKSELAGDWVKIDTQKSAKTVEHDETTEEKEPKEKSKKK